MIKNKKIKPKTTMVRMRVDTRKKLEKLSAKMGMFRTEIMALLVDKELGL